MQKCQSRKMNDIILCRFYVFILVYVSYCYGLKFSSVNKPYQKGVQAYSGERWSECIIQFEESLHLYKLSNTIIINCRLQCNSQNHESHIKTNLEDLRLIEKFFNTRDCLTKCQERGFEDVHLKNDVEESMITIMQARKPYEYLHVCYFQMNAMPKAASAAYTYIMANPDDDIMKKNLEYYIQQPEVDIKEIVDFESEDYTVMYKLGIQAYNKKNWGETIASMEEVLTDYISWENRCRVECERQPEQEWSPELVITVSNTFASLLHCRQQCQEQLIPLGYKSGIEFLADILNYMQISYYHLDKFNDAAKSVASYLLLLPSDEDMLENKKIYSSLIALDAFVERHDIEYYYNRDNYEKNLLMFFHKGVHGISDSNAI